MSNYRLQHLRQALGDRYEFEALLGKGAFASVYLVRNLRLKRREALKVLADTYESDSSFARRFVAEATTVASLDHPHIVQIYDYGEIDGIIWCSMQYIEGATLRAELTARGRFDAGAALHILLPILAALDFSHQRGIVHRDVKPANVLLGLDGRPFLTDFGIAKSADSTLTTMTGSVLGTPAYMAPEQVEGQPLDGRADLYSLGVTLYETLSGHLPFLGTDPFQILLRRLKEDPNPLSSHLPGIDPELEAIVMRALARDRERRFANAGELRRRLLAVHGGEEDLPAMELVAITPVVSLIERPPTTESALPIPTQVVPSLGSDEAAAGVPIALPAVAPPRWRRWALASLLAAGLVAGGLAWRARTPVAGAPAGVSLGVPASASAGVPANAEASVPAHGPATGGSPSDKPTAAAPTASELATAASALPVEPAPVPAASKPSSRRDAPAGTEPSRPAVTNPTGTAESATGPRRAVTFPRLLEEAQPQLTTADAALCAGKSVVLAVQVGADGHPTGARALVADAPACAAAAEAAVRRFVFAPGKDAAGQPVEASTTLTLRFGELPP